MCRGLRIVKIDMKKSNQFKYQFKNAMDCGWLFNKLRKLFTKKRALQQNHVNLLNFFRNKVLQDYEKHHFSTSGRTAYISFSWAENIGAYQTKPEILKMHGFFQYPLAGQVNFSAGTEKSRISFALERLPQVTFSLRYRNLMTNCANMRINLQILSLKTKSLRSFGSVLNLYSYLRRFRTPDFIFLAICLNNWN